MLHAAHSAPPRSPSPSPAFLHVFWRPLAKAPPPEPWPDLPPRERMAEILACKHPTVRAEKHQVWHLLLEAMQQVLPPKKSKPRFTKQENGQWTCDTCFFSLSHSKGLLAVAVSSSPVGIDVERRSERLRPSILTPGELAAFPSLPAADRAALLTAAWTRKESLFKMQGGISFNPQALDTEHAPLLTQRILWEEETFFLSVCSEAIGALQLHPPS